MTPRDSIAAIKAFQHALSGNVVSPEEVRRRGNVCATCPKRERVRNSVSKISRFLGMLANRHRLPKEIKDFACGVCGCSLQLLLPATKEDLHKDSPEEAAKRPEQCWLTSATKSD
jgi:hypothetical protein